MNGTTITHDGDVTRFTLHGATYVLKGPYTKTLRDAANQYGDDAQAGAFWKGVLCTLTMIEAVQTKEQANGKAG